MAMQPDIEHDIELDIENLNVSKHLKTTLK